MARKVLSIGVILVALCLALNANPVGAVASHARNYLLMQNIRDMACGDPDWSFDTDIRGNTPASGLTAEELWTVSLRSTVKHNKPIVTVDTGRFVPSFLVPNYPAPSNFVTTRSFGTNGSFIVPSNESYTLTFKLYTFVNNVMTAKSIARLKCSVAPRTMTELSLKNLCRSQDPEADTKFKTCFTPQR